MFSKHVHKNQVKQKQTKDIIIYQFALLQRKYKEEVRQKRHLLLWSGHRDIILYNPALQYQPENENNHNHKQSIIGIELSLMNIFFKYFGTKEYTDLFRSHHLASRIKFLVREALVFEQSPF